MNQIALGNAAAVSFVLPLIILLIVFIKRPTERKGLLASFFAGCCIGLVFEWLIKEQALKWLFHHTDIQSLADRYYLVYVFLIALAGALLALVPEFLLVSYVYRNKISFAKTAMLGLGSAMVEAVALVGLGSIKAMLELNKNENLELVATPKALFLSSFERCLVMIIQVAVTVVLVYFMENKMPVRGLVIAGICHVMEGFIPGFLAAFTTKDFLELYTKDTAALLTDGILLMMAVCGAVTMNGLKYLFQEE